MSDHRSIEHVVLLLIAVGISVLIAAIVAGLLYVLAAFVVPYPARGHDIYRDWKRPGSGISCCSARDCYATPAKFERGSWYALRRRPERLSTASCHLSRGHDDPCVRRVSHLGYPSQKGRLS